MPFINWNSSYSIGIKRIDDQHAMLIDMINDFHEKLEKGERIESLTTLFSGLKYYTMRHFTDEESYMIKYNYIEYPQHKAQHDMFIDQMVALEERFKNGDNALPLEVMIFLKEWLLSHIKGTDKKYVAHFLSNGMV